MQLPGSWFEQIIRSLDASSAAAVSSMEGEGIGQRRREPRVGVRANVTLIPLTDGDGLGATPRAVPVRDISPGGLGFLHAGKVGLDAQFVALLPHGEESVAVLCRVAYYQPMAERLFSVGATFVRVLRRPACDDVDLVLSLPLAETAPQWRAAS